MMILMKGWPSIQIKLGGKLLSDKLFRKKPDRKRSSTLKSFSRKLFQAVF